MTTNVLSSLALLASAVSLSVSADENQNKTFQLPHLASKVSIDGDLSDPVWKDAIKMQLDYENNPGQGIAANQKTEMWLYEDGKTLYVAFKAYDTNPEQIRASLRDRDSLWDDDNVGLIIDTFNDERSGYEFFVNPLGAQADMRMDDSNGWDEDSSWDAIWDSAGQLTEYGFAVEMAIPFSALRFPESTEALTWTVAGWRNHPRDVRKQFATFKQDKNITCNFCQMDKLVGFESIKPSKNFQFTPTLTASKSDSKEDVPGPWNEGDVEYEVGADIRWGITQDIVLNATLNPDFSQVEADASQLDINNTFSLFYREKRPFFLDGASYFNSERFNFVHTRNIADPDYGVKLTGKTNGHSYGVLVANDNNTSFLIPGSLGSNVATLDQSSEVVVAKYKQDIGERSQIGALVTNRSANGYNNTLLSVDGAYSINESDTISYNVATSETDNTDMVVEDFDVKKNQSDQALSVAINRNTRDYGLKASYTNVGDDFRADVGFMGRVDYERLVLGGSQTWYGKEGDWLNRYGYFGDWDKTYDQDGKMLEEEIEIHGNLQGQMQFYTNFGVVHRKRYYNGHYYKETQPMMYARITPYSGIRFDVFTRLGKQIDFANDRLGDIVVFEPTITWDANEHLKLQISQNYRSLDVKPGNLFTAQQSDIRATYQFDMRSNLKFVLQFTDIDRNADLYVLEEGETDDDRPDSNEKYFSSQLIYSYKVNPQTLFYLGYSTGGYQDDGLEEIERDSRTAFAKFSYAWQL